MTTTINASTSSGLVVTPDNSGNVLLQYNGQSAPAFSAYLGTNQVMGSAAFTKVQINTETFDTNSNFDTANYRFTPTVAGYYQISCAFNVNATTTRAIVSIYKNGSEFYRGTDLPLAVNSITTSALIYLNGSTDYVEFYAYCVFGGSLSLASGSNYTWFQGCLLRGA